MGAYTDCQFTIGHKQCRLKIKNKFDVRLELISVLLWKACLRMATALTTKLPELLCLVENINNV